MLRRKERNPEMELFITLYRRPDQRVEWHVLRGRTYIAVSPTSFKTRAGAKRNAKACIAAFKTSKTTIVWGK